MTDVGGPKGNSWRPVPPKPPTPDGSGGDNFATRYDNKAYNVKGDARPASYWLQQVPQTMPDKFPVRVQYERAMRTGIVTKARKPTSKVRIATQGRKRYQYSQSKGLRKVQRKRDDYYEAWYF